MKRNISSLLQRGNLTPKERVLLMIHDAIKQEQGGKETLTEADKEALTSGWTPKDNNQVAEFNRWNDGWRNTVFAELDAQTTYLRATNDFLRASKYLDYVMLKTLNRYKEAKETHKEKLGRYVSNSFFEDDKLDKKEALKITLSVLGLKLDYTIYRFAFETASKDLQKDLIILYPDAKTEQDYLEEEETIAELFNGKDTLTIEAKEKLAELIADKAYNKYSREWTFDGYYAELPLFELLGKFALYYKQMPKNPETFHKHFKGEPYKDESEELEDCFNVIKKELIPRLTSYAKKHKKDVKSLVKDIVLKWLDNGLFTKDFTAIFNSDAKETCNEQDTKLSHKEVFKQWIKVKTKAKETIQELIDKGDLEVEERERELKALKKLLGNKGVAEDNDKAFKDTQTIITGESLYNLKGDFKFIKNFREQADEYIILGYAVVFLQGRNFIKEYAILLGFLELFKGLSKAFEIDLTHKIIGYITSFNRDLDILKHSFILLGDDIMQASYEKHGDDRIFYFTESYIEDLIIMPIDIKSIKPDTQGRLNIYFEKFKEILGDDF